MKAFVLGLVVGLALLLAGTVATLIATGLSTRPEPPRFEAALARAVRRWAVPAEIREMRNPVPPGPKVQDEALRHFADHCAGCHGNDGSGKTELGRAFYPRAPDMRGPETQRLTDGELFYVIENGIRFTAMPGWGGAGKPEESWKLVHFIRHLPRVTAEERARMEALNPRSPEDWREQQEEDRFLRGDDASAPPSSEPHQH